MFAGTISAPAFEGVMLNASPLQIVCVLFAILGFALTFTTIVKLSPVHGPTGEVGVRVYVAVFCALVGLVKLPLKPVCPDADAPPVIPPVTVGVVQV